MRSIIVERSLAVPLEKEDCEDLSRSVACFTVLNVRFVESFVSERRDHLICRFEAPDIESVRQALRGAGLEFDRIWGARIVRRRNDVRQPLDQPGA